MLSKASDLRSQGRLFRQGEDQPGLKSTAERACNALATPRQGPHLTAGRPIAPSCESRPNLAVLDVLGEQGRFRLTRLRGWQAGVARRVEAERPRVRDKYDLSQRSPGNRCHTTPSPCGTASASCRTTSSATSPRHTFRPCCSIAFHVVGSRRSGDHSILGFVCSTVNSRQLLGEGLSNQNVPVSDQKKSLS